MPIADAYATPQQLRTWPTAEKSSTADDTQIKLALQAASRLIDQEQGQFFGREDAAIARVFCARRSDELDLTYESDCPGIADLTDLAIKVDTDGDGSFSDETAWVAGDYELRPLQAASGPEARPWNMIIVPSYSSKSFVPGNLVEVTAIWGWPAVPSDIVIATIELAALILLMTPRATSSIDDMQRVVGMSTAARNILTRLQDAYSTKVTF